MYNLLEIPLPPLPYGGCFANEVLATCHLHFESSGLLSWEITSEVALSRAQKQAVEMLCGLLEQGGFPKDVVVRYGGSHDDRREGARHRWRRRFLSSLGISTYRERKTLVLAISYYCNLLAIPLLIS